MVLLAAVGVLSLGLALFETQAVSQTAESPQLAKNLAAVRNHVSTYAADSKPASKPDPALQTALLKKLDAVVQSASPADRHRICAEILLSGFELSKSSSEDAFALQKFVANHLVESHKPREVADIVNFFAAVDQFESVAIRQVHVPESYAAVFRLNAVALIPQTLLERPEEQLELCSKINGEEADSVWPGFRAAYWNMRGRLAVRKNRYSDAFRFYAEAVGIQTAMEDKAAAAETRLNLATLSMDLGDFSRAKVEWTLASNDLEQLATDKNRDSNFRYAANGLRLITKVYLTRPLVVTGRYRSAIEQLDLILEEPGEHLEEKTIAKNEKAMCLYSMGNFGEAHKLWMEARKHYAVRPSDAALIDVNLGWNAYSQNKTSEAEEKFRAALAAISPERKTEVQSYLARVLADQGKSAEAIEFLKTALDESESSIDLTLRSALSERDRQAFLLKLRRHTEQSVWPGVFDTYLELAPRLRISESEQYERVLRWKGRLQGHSIAENETKSTKERQALIAERESLLQSLRRLTIAARRLEEQASQSSEDEQELATLRDSIRERDQEIGDIERKVREIDESSVTESVRRPLDLKSVTEVLSEKSALLDIVVASSYRTPQGEGHLPPQHTIGFLIERDGKVRRVDLGDADLLAVEARAFTEAIISQSAIEEVQQRLDRMISRPIQNMMPSVELLYVSGDGWVHRIPLGALSGKQTRFWIEEVAFAQVASAHALVRRRKSQASPDAGLVVGGLDYGQGNGQVWPYLYGTWLESQQFEEALRNKSTTTNVTFLVGQQCSKETLQSRLRESRIVHLATHGYFSDRESDLGGIYDVSSQMDSGLVLSNANVDSDAEEQYLLTAEELGRERLSHIELMVLSACNTGLGHLSHGEGIIGLLGALDRAGVRSVVSALWEVDDAATMKLMGAFYKHCLNRDLAHPAQAMRQAQIEMLRGELSVEDRVKEELEKPFFWAAWSVMGWSG